MNLKKYFKNPTQIIMMLFIVSMIMTATYIKIPVKPLLSDLLIRLGMNGIIVLALIPMINTGIGINYGLPIGIVCGLLGMCISINFKNIGLKGFLLSLIFSIPFSILFGYFYALILNRLKGQEEISGTFIGFSFISLMSIFWATAPFSNPAMLWPIGGKGMRPTIGLKNYFEGILNNFWNFELWGIKIPFGLLLILIIFCIIVKLFFKTKIGKAMIAVGENERFAEISGINVNRCRSLAIIMSTIIAAFGICIYEQSYGFIELYEAPLMAAFPAASSILIGGNIGGRADIAQVIIGTFMFQSIYVFSTPISNHLLVPEFAEIIRMMITNLIILSALLYRGGNKNEKC